MTTQLWTASVHLPGCLPDTDSSSAPPVFTDPASAWDYLQDDRTLAFSDADEEVPADDNALVDIGIMIKTTAHNQYGTVQGPDPVNPDNVLCYTVEPLPVEDFLSNHTVASAMDAILEQIEAWAEDPGPFRASADETHDLLLVKAVEAEIYRAAHDAYVNLGMQQTGCTIDDVLLNEVAKFFLSDTDYLSEGEAQDLLVQYLVEAQALVPDHTV